MANLLSRRYMPLRASILLIAGIAIVLGARARHLQNQEPPVKRSPAPELVGADWLNTDKPITLASRRGNVTMVEFWTFACSNCQANLPAYERMQKRFAPRGFTIVAIHTPELPEEKKRENIVKFVKQHGISYPVLLDLNQANWDRWNQEFWPVIYLIDKSGNICEKWVGELNSLGSDGEAKIDRKIEALLAE